MSNEFVRARCDATGHLAALPQAALEAGFIPGWREVEGPVPDGPKPAAFPERYQTLGDEETDESADGESADQEEE